MYAFGVVLLELIIGRKPIDTVSPKGQESLIMWVSPGFYSWLSSSCLFILIILIRGSCLTFCKCWNQARPLLQDGNMESLADKCLQNVYDTNEMHRMMLAATLCLRETSHYRPCMSRVIYLPLFISICFRGLFLLPRVFFEGILYLQKLL